MKILKIAETAVFLVIHDLVQKCLKRLKVFDKNWFSWWWDDPANTIVPKSQAVVFSISNSYVKKLKLEFLLNSTKTFLHSKTDPYSPLAALVIFLQKEPYCNNWANSLGRKSWKFLYESVFYHFWAVNRILHKITAKIETLMEIDSNGNSHNFTSTGYFPLPWKLAFFFAQLNDDKRYNHKGYNN